MSRQYTPNPPGAIPPSGPPHNPYGPPDPPGESKATASLICGIISIFCFQPLGIAGIILAIQAKNEGYIGSKHTIGLVLSIIALALLVLSIIVAIIIIIFLPEIINEIWYWLERIGNL